MSANQRIILAVFLGGMVGFYLGPITLATLYARHVVLGLEKWPEVSLELLCSAAITSIPSCINGCIGGWSAARTGLMNRGVVTIFPLTFQFLSCLFSLEVRGLTIIGIQLYSLSFTVVMWASGRIGQRIGRSLYQRTDQAGNQDELDYSDNQRTHLE